MPAVSILIPAYEAEYLGRAILSAQQQTFENVEILVGDDTPDGLLREIVERFDDPRVRYFHHGFQNDALNLRALWEKARGQYVKWLFADDLLMPTSVEVLVNALRANPGVALAFHGRVIIDGSDAVVARPEQLLPAGQAALIGRQSLVENMLGRLNNFVGEPTNIILVRERVDISRAFDYRTWKLDFLRDVALYLNCAEQAPLLTVGGYLSAHRQTSEAALSQRPDFAAGLYEWELMVRGEAAAGNLSSAALASAARGLHRIYSHWAEALPEIARLLANLHELSTAPSHHLYASEQFVSDLTRARAVVAERIAQVADLEPAQLTKFCVVCEQPVAEWLSQPAAHDIDASFPKQVGAVGVGGEVNQCPRCGCADHERHLWLYLAFSRILEDVGQKRVLHVAPENGVEQRMRRLAPREYVVGDASPRLPQHRSLDVEKLDFPDGYFDIIICNQVLDCVGDAEAALAELNRCLAPGGHLVAQTAYSPLLRNTLELTRPAPPTFRSQYFGAAERARLFGADLIDRIRASGLAGDAYPHETVLVEVDPPTYGCNGDEPFFFFSKSDRAPRFGM